jgi:nitrile hydratase
VNGPQDLGGAMGFGPVAPEMDEPLFHAEWEPRALGLTLAAGALGHWSIDEGRHARESLPPATYLSASYYEIWARALADLLVRHGEVTPEELAEGRALEPGRATDRRLTPEAARAAVTTSRGYDRPEPGPARFAPGDRVRTRNLQPRGHIRLPGYARDKEGVVEAVRGCHVLPDTSAQGNTETGAWLYSVAFEGRTLWGEDAAPGLTVALDLFEPYLDAA